MFYEVNFTFCELENNNTNTQENLDNFEKSLKEISSKIEVHKSGQTISFLCNRKDLTMIYNIIFSRFDVLIITAFKVQ